MEVEEDTLKAIEFLSSSSSVGAAEERLAEQTGERYDLTALANLLLQKGFVARIDGRDVESDAPRGKGKTIFSFVPPRVARLIRHPIVIAGAAFLFLQYALSLAIGAVAPPRFGDAALTSRPLLNVSLVMGGMLLMAFLHELAHYFTARSYGLDPKIAISHRFYIAVLTTDVTDAWTLPRRPQLAIFSAGILFNLSAMGVCGFFLSLDAAQMLDLSAGSARLLRFLVLVNGFPLLFQLFLVARTDLYYILQSVTGNRNLSRDALSYLGMRIGRAWKLLRRRPGAPCPDCRATRFDTEPFCVGCGAQQAVADPNRYAFRYKDRRLLASFGVLSVVGFAIMVPLMLAMFYRIASLNLRLYGLLPQFVAEREWLLFAESLLAVVFLAFVLMFAVWRVLQLVLLPARYAWQLLIQRFSTLPEPVKRSILRLMMLQLAWKATRAYRALRRILPDNGQGNTFRPRWAQGASPIQSRSGEP